MSANTENYSLILTELAAARKRVKQLEQAEAVLRTQVGKEAELVKGERTSAIIFGDRVVRCVVNRHHGYDIYNGTVSPANRIRTDVRDSLNGIKLSVVMGQI